MTDVKEFQQQSGQAILQILLRLIRSNDKEETAYCKGMLDILRDQINANDLVLSIHVAVYKHDEIHLKNPIPATFNETAIEDELNQSNTEKQTGQENCYK